MHALEGVTYSTLSHGEGLAFSGAGQIYRTLPNCWAGCWMHQYRGARDGVQGGPKYFDWLVLLKFCTWPLNLIPSSTPLPIPASQKIAEFLLFDSEFPHSICFSVDRVTDALARVAPGAPPARRAAVERLAGRLKASVDFGQIDELMSGGIAAFLADITRQCEKIHEALMHPYMDRMAPRQSYGDFSKYPASCSHRARSAGSADTSQRVSAVPPIALQCGGRKSECAEVS